MKVFLSHPMSGLAEKDVMEFRNKALDKLKELYDEVELIDNYHHEDVPEKAGRIWHLGTSIRMMEEADIVFFYGDWRNSPGCAIEHKICKDYGIPFVCDTLEMKYEVLKDGFIRYPYKKGYVDLYRIRALKDFGSIKKGDVGGFVTGYDNLSHCGNCWIYDNAMVFDNAKIYDNAIVKNNAIIRDDAIVDGFAAVINSAIVEKSAIICNYGKVLDNAKVSDKAAVLGDSIVRGNAIIDDHAAVNERAVVDDNAVVTGYASLYGDSCVNENARVEGKASICRNAKIHGYVIVGGRSTISTDADVSSYLQYMSITGPCNEQLTFYTGENRSGKRIYVSENNMAYDLSQFTQQVEKEWKDNEILLKQYKTMIDFVKSYLDIEK